MIVRATAFPATEGRWICTGTYAFSDAPTTDFITGRPKAPGTPGAIHCNRDNLKLSSAEPKVIHNESPQRAQIYLFDYKLKGAGSKFFPTRTATAQSFQTITEMIKIEILVTPKKRRERASWQNVSEEKKKKEKYLDVLPTVNLPGHECVLHHRLSRASPSQGFPP